jgi:hypothetical protein
VYITIQTFVGVQSLWQPDELQCCVQLDLPENGSGYSLVSFDRTSELASSNMGAVKK